MSRGRSLILAGLLTVACAKKEPFFPEDVRAVDSATVDAALPAALDAAQAMDASLTADVAPPRDAAPTPDARARVVDAAPLDLEPLLDASPDVTLVVVDATPLEPDAAPPEPDAAPPEPDAAPPEPDAAPPEPDAAPPEPDAAPPEPDAAPGRHPVLDGPVPPFDALAADEIEALCADQVAQIADLVWVAQQVGTDAFTLEEAHCAYLVGRTAANANHPVQDCEERLPACVETVRDIFEAGDFLQADCTGALAAGRAAGCQSSASLYLDCLRDGYPQRVSFGFTANQLARLSLMDCEEIVASVQNFLPRMNPPLSCTLLRRRCDAAAPPP